MALSIYLTIVLLLDAILWFFVLQLAIYERDGAAIYVALFLLAHIGGAVAIWI